MGKTFDDLLPELAEGLKLPYQQVFATGEPFMGCEITGQTNASPGEVRHWIADFYPVRFVGRVFAVGGSVREATDQTRMIAKITIQNDHQKLLLGELQRRVKNTLATIAAISRMLLRPCRRRPRPNGSQPAGGRARCAGGLDRLAFRYQTRPVGL